MQWGYLHCLKDALGLVLIISSSCSESAAHLASVSASAGEREGIKLPTPHKTLEILAVSHSNKHVAQGLNAFTLQTAWLEFFSSQWRSQKKMGLPQSCSLLWNLSHLWASLSAPTHSAVIVHITELQLEFRGCEWVKSCNFFFSFSIFPLCFFFFSLHFKHFSMLGFFPQRKLPCSSWSYLNVQLTKIGHYCHCAQKVDILSAIGGQML